MMLFIVYRGYRERTLHRWDLAEPQLKSDHVKKEKKKKPHTGEVIKEKDAILYTHKSFIMCTITFPSLL